MKIIVAGGAGSLGTKLVQDLVGRGHSVVVLTRSPGTTDYGVPVTAGNLKELQWDGKTLGPWATEFEPSKDTDDDAATLQDGIGLVNLAGKLVDCRPTRTNIAALTSSRVDSTKVLVEASRQAALPLTRWVQASTTAIWSDAGEQHITESTPLPSPGLAQMTGVAQPWEAAAAGANTEFLSILRTSIVLGADFPAMARLHLLAKLGLGGKVSHGRQWFSWIHLEDWLAIVRAGLGLEPSVNLPEGIVLGAAPNPVRNAELMRIIREAAGVPFGLPTPAAVLRLGATAMRTDPALGLTGRYCTSEVLPAAGFTFRYPQLTAEVVAP